MRKFSILASACLTAASLATPATAAILIFSAPLAGTNEFPVNASPGTGFVTVTVDDVLNTINIESSFSGLLGTTTAAHIHCCTLPGANAGVAVGPGTLPGFPLGVTSGSYNGTLDLMLASTYTSGFITSFGGGTVGGARNRIITELGAGKTYFNVHSTTFPGGEIRGQLAAIPEPASWALMIGGFAIVGGMLRRRRKLATA